MQRRHMHSTSQQSHTASASAACYGHALDDASTRAGNPAGVRPIAQRLTHLDLFSGIGGFALAARMVGNIKTVAFCEREPYAQRVLRKHWPETPICDDIHKLNGNDYGPIDLVTGGFPCQPYSLAGERRGNADDRALWPQMLRVIREARPAWVIGENVPGIISLALDGVLADLEREGYACETFLVGAVAVDAKHRRNRVWIVAHASGKQDDGQRGESGRHYVLGRLALGDGAQASQSQDGEANADHTHGRGATAAVSNGISRRPGAGRQDGPQTSDDGEDVAVAESQRLGDGDDGELLGSGAGEVHASASTGRTRGRLEAGRWIAEPDVGRVAHGIPARVDRLRGLGNAIVPQVAAAFLDAIAAIEFAEQVAGVPGALAGHLGGASPLRNAKARNA